MKRVGGPPPAPRLRPRPGELRSLAEVRGAIDAIDQRLVALRAARVIENARRLARAHGMDPDLAVRIYRAMIAAFIDDEMVEHRRLGAKRSLQRRSG